MRSTALVCTFALAVAAVLAACPAQNTPQPMPPPEPPSTVYQPPPSTGEPAPSTPAPTAPPEDPDRPLLGANGDPCESAADCESNVCEGQGCGQRQGVCAPARRACTRDAAPFCSCDGLTFTASSRCPGQRFQHRGECRSQLADGASCAAGAECASGVCEGQGCGSEPTGTCVPARRRCTKDRRAFCGCDGRTFYGSGTCPGARYAALGECAK